MNKSSFSVNTNIFDLFSSTFILDKDLVFLSYHLILNYFYPSKLSVFKFSNFSLINPSDLDSHLKHVNFTYHEMNNFLLNHSNKSYILSFSYSDVITSNFSFLNTSNLEFYNSFFIFLFDSNFRFKSLFILDFQTNSNHNCNFSNFISYYNSFFEEIYTNNETFKKKYELFDSFSKDLIEFSLNLPTANNFFSFSTFCTKFLQSIISPISVSYYFFSNLSSDFFFSNLFESCSNTFLDQIKDELFSYVNFFKPNHHFNYDYDLHHFFDSSSNTAKNSGFSNSSSIPIIYNDYLLGFIHIVHNVDFKFTSNQMFLFLSFLSVFSLHLSKFFNLFHNSFQSLSFFINSIKDPVVFLDSSHKPILYNSAAFKSFENMFLNKIPFLTYFSNTLIPSHYSKVFSSKLSASDIELEFFDHFYSVIITPVTNNENLINGTLLIFRDISKVLQSNITKAKRLDIISKVNLIIKSITDLDHLLAVLLKLIMDLADVEMASVLIKEDNIFSCKLHINLPEKIRKLYTFSDGSLISDSVLKSKKPIYIPNYSSTKNVSQNTKILLDWLLCIPILIHGEAIGVFTLAKKLGGTSVSLNDDDLTTLITITDISGTAINNSLFYQSNVKQQALEHELKVARDIHAKLLPRILPSIKNIQFSVFSKPSRHIGGDYYDFFTLSETKIGIVIADIVGKGVPAGLFMAMLKSILSAYLPFYDSPKLALIKVNEILLKERIIDKFIPLFYGILDNQSLEFTYSNAGHEPVLLLSKGKFIILDTNGLPLASLKGTQYCENKISLTNMDRLFFFTDGFIESRHSINGFFGIDNFKKAILKYNSLESSQLISKLYNHLKNFSGLSPEFDDLTLLIIDIGNNSSPSEPLVLNTFKIKVKSRKEYIKSIRSELHAFLLNVNCSDQMIHDLKLVINEAQINIIEHAYLDKEDGDILFTFFHYESYVKIKIRDYGKKFDYSKIIDKTPDFINLEGSGLGLFLIKTLVDKMEFLDHPRGTELVLTKYFKKGE